MCWSKEKNFHIIDIFTLNQWQPVSLKGSKNIHEHFVFMLFFLPLFRLIMIRIIGNWNMWHVWIPLSKFYSCFLKENWNLPFHRFLVFTSIKTLIHGQNGFQKCTRILCVLALSPNTNYFRKLSVFCMPLILYRVWFIIGNTHLILFS